MPTKKLKPIDETIEPPKHLIFAANVAKMGDKRIIVIPKSLHEMLKAFEAKDLTVTLSR